MARHPHADVIIAFAEGKTIQYKDTNGWCDWNGYQNQAPCFYPEAEYRIKPEPKPDIIGWMQIDSGATACLAYTSNVVPMNFNGANVKITLDGETYQLKAVELINKE